MNVLAVIQCRLGSKRLKKKALLKLGKHTTLEWVIRRVKKSKQINKIVLATSKNIGNKKLISIAKKLKIDFFKGSEKNVFSRFYNLNKIYKPKFIVRICADNPFIDANEIDKIIKKSKLLNNNFSYVFNHIPYKKNNYIDGVGAECISAKYFTSFGDKIKKEKHKEHVTKFIWENKNIFLFKSIIAPKKFSFPRLSLDIDYKKDYIKFSKLLKNYKNKPENYKVENLIYKLT